MRFHIQNLNSEPPIKLLSFPDDVAVEITFLAYVCIYIAVATCRCKYGKELKEAETSHQKEKHRRSI